ncbi:amidohydrolase family protein [Latilactobacillus fragifolii]
MSAKQAFYMATVGGAASLGIPADAIEPGLLADLQII